MPAPTEAPRWRRWAAQPAPRWLGGNRVELLQGGDEMFPRMVAAIDAAASEVWLATYIYTDDPSTIAVADALDRAARRGVAVKVVVDGFGSRPTLPWLRRRCAASGVQLEVFRPIERWYAWLQPGQLRRLHQKLCVCDRSLAFVGGINLIDDRHDLGHGWAEAPRLDFAVALEGPLAASVQVAASAIWVRSHLLRAWSAEMRELARSERPLTRARSLVRRLRSAGSLPGPDAAPAQPMRAALLVRDNLRQRRTIERSYIAAIQAAQHRVDLAVPYFYPGRLFRRALRRAARRGVEVRLLLQGKIDYRFAALAAQALYDELCAQGVRIYEYTPAFLHAKVAVVDGRWATVGSSNIDPMSLLLNLEANVVVEDAGFAAELQRRLEAAFAASAEVSGRAQRSGWRGWLQRGFVAWVAAVYLRMAGVTGRY
ncbi:MAG: cardiolipin synthase ClsB [Burkholderiales bacterium]|nr:cardiolipin synthase ClsB [Burkholderiales bacterium]